TVTLALLPAAGLHLLLALPDGRLVRASHRTTVVVGYGLSAAIGLALALGSDPGPRWPVALTAPLAFLIGSVVSHGRSRRAHVPEPQRMPWFGAAVARPPE